MTSSKASAIAQHVRELVVTGQVAAGDFLRLEPLAVELGSSVTPVREAMNQLVAEGIVALRPRRGFEVLPISDADLADTFWAQAMLAGELAARAVHFLSPRDVDGLESLQRTLETAATTDRRDEIEGINHEFHRRINSAAEAPRLSRLLSITTRLAPRDFFASVQGWTEASASDHHDIIDAFRAQDAERVRSSMQEHISNAGRLLIEHRRRSTAPATEPNDRRS